MRTTRSLTACHGGHAWWGGAWQGVCVAVGACVWQGGQACVAGGMHGRGGHVWQGACMAGGHAWQGACVAGGYMAGVCMVGGACMAEGGMCGGGVHVRQGVCMPGGSPLWTE